MTNNDSVTEYDDEDLILLSKLGRRKERTEVLEIFNVFTKQNLTSVDIQNWLANDEDLLPLEDIDATDKHHDSESPRF